MVDCSPEEKARAATKWFALLGALSRIAERHVSERADSRDHPDDDRVGDASTNV